MTTPLSGQDFHGYILGDKVYEGGFGEIYKATSPDGQTTAAVKVIRSAVSQDDAFRKRFLREIQLLQTVRHQNIIPIIAFGFKSQHYYLIMPFIKGTDLNELMSMRRFTPQDAWGFVEPIAAALHCGHQQNIIHRDLKPENILVEQDGDQVVKYYLSDFGLAKRPGVDQTLTAAGKMLGTPEYLSPEYILDTQELDARADIYSLAVMTYELLLGVVPFGTGNHYDIILAHTRTPPPAPSSLRRDFPPALETFLLKNLEKDRNKRYSTALDFSQAFHEALLALPEDQRKTCYWII